MTSLDSLLASLPFVSSLKERQAGLWLDASILYAQCGSVLLQRLPFNLFLPAFILAITSSFYFIQWLTVISTKAPFYLTLSLLQNQ